MMSDTIWVYKNGQPALRFTAKTFGRIWLGSVYAVNGAWEEKQFYRGSAFDGTENFGQFETIDEAKRWLELYCHMWIISKQKSKAEVA